MRRSSLRSLLGVVSSLSPSKMLFAPARKHSACGLQAHCCQALTPLQTTVVAHRWLLSTPVQELHNGDVAYMDGGLHWLCDDHMPHSIEATADCAAKVKAVPRYREQHTAVEPVRSERGTEHLVSEAEVQASG